jgi:putative salt-induced outer membrane protein YdiY
MRVLTMLVLFFAGAIAFADDEVKLKNGDRLTGSIKSLAGGKLLIETVATGPIKVDWAQVVSVKTDNPVKVRLVTGDVVEGKIVPGAEGKLKVESPGTVAPVEVEMAKITHFNQPPVQWHGNLNAAAKATDGNTHVRSFLISGEGTRETESDLILIRAIFRYAETSGTLSERNSYGIGQYNLKFSPSFYAFLSEELQGDTFKDLRLRTITSAGLGYQVLKEKDYDLAAEAGIAYITNDFTVANDESHLGARCSVRGRVALPLGFELKDSFTIYPNFKNSQDYQFRNEATLGTALGGGWTALGGVITEYDNKPSPGVKKADDTYFIGLGYTF